ncbi:MAG: flagellar hook-basal body complex protein FliE [Paracoccaceae bacterium]
MDIRSALAGIGYSQARGGISPGGVAAGGDSGRQTAGELGAGGIGAGGIGAGGAITGFARDFADTLRQGEATAIKAMQGGADPHALVLALAESQLAVETAVTLRDKVVEAYQEILRMPV